MKIRLFAAVFVMISGNIFAQNMTPLDSAIRNLSQIKSPDQTVFRINKIIQFFHLDRKKDAETMDLLYGTAAVNYAVQKNESGYYKYIGLIQNKFNKTSFMSTAAAEILRTKKNTAFATKIAKQTIDLYGSFKEDSTARPKDFEKADWKRFMDFAQYPYYDTYAHALYEGGNYKEALQFQKMAFDGPPEEGLPESVERYARLLELSGDQSAAKQLLLSMAKRGRLNQGMTAQLQSIAEKGNDKSLSKLVDSLQKNVQKSLTLELKPKMLNETAPEFSLKDINGKTISLSDYRGKIVVLDLWATWCLPCIASFPAMQNMVKNHPEVAFLFIAVEEKGGDPLKRVKTFIESRKYPFTVLMDEPIEPTSNKFKVITAYHPNGIPAKYIIDKNGILRFRTSGFDTDTELINELEATFTILNTL